MYNKNKIKDTIQDCNINFLLGSGLSKPYLETLGKIEFLLTELEEAEIDQDIKNIIRVSLYKKYFDEVIKKNPKIIEDDANSKEVLDYYHHFIKTIK